MYGHMLFTNSAVATANKQRDFLLSFKCDGIVLADAIKLKFCLFNVCLRV